MRLSLRLLLLLLAGFLVGGSACRRKEKKPVSIVYLNGQDIRGLDPHTTALSWQTHNVFSNVYEALVGFDKNHSLVPGLATSWKNVDELTWEFQIRPGVAFHCGGVLTASDIAFSIERALTHPKSYLRSYLSNVASVEAVGGQRVRLRTKHPDGFLLPRVRSVFIAPRGFLERADQDPHLQQACGTGPYVLASWKKGESVELASFAEYWGPRGEIARASFLARSYDDGLKSTLPPDARLAFFLRPTSGLYASALKVATPHRTLTLSVSLLAFDLRDPAAGPESSSPPNPFLDRRVREAVSKVIDYGKLRKELGLSDRSEASQFVPPHVFGFDPSLASPEYSPEEGRKVIAEVIPPEARAITLVVRSAMAEIGAPIARDLSAAGFSVNVVYPPDEATGGVSVPVRAPALHLIRHSCRTGDAQEFFERWLHSKVPETGYGKSNVGYDVNPIPGLDEAIEEAGREMDPLVRKRLLQKVMREAVSSYVAIPLLNDEETLFVEEGVTWEPRADSLRLLVEAVPE